EDYGLPGQGVEGGGESARRAEEAHAVGAGRVEGDEDDARALGSGGGRGERVEQDRGQEGEEPHRSDADPIRHAPETRTRGCPSLPGRGGSARSDWRPQEPRAPDRSRFYKSSVSANCIERGPPWAITGFPAPTSGLEVSLPKAPLRTLKVADPMSKFARFRTLKTSQRNCTFMFFPRLVILTRERSHCERPGPSMVLRPQVPTVPSAGTENTWSAFPM